MMKRKTLLTSVLLPLTVVASTASATREKIAVLDVKVTGLDAAIEATLTEVLTTEIYGIDKFDVISGADINTMLGFENKKELLGCTDAACVAEIGGALGVDKIVVSHVGKLGATYVINMKVINIRRGRAEGRAYETVQGEIDSLIGKIQLSAYKVFNLPAPGSAPAVAQQSPPPQPVAEQPQPQPKPNAVAQPTQTASRQVAPSGRGPWPYVAGGVGALSLSVAGYFWLQAKDAYDKTRDRTLIGRQVELDRGRTAQTRAYIALATGVVAGAAAAALWVLRGDDRQEQVALSVTPVRGGGWVAAVLLH